MIEKHHIFMSPATPDNLTSATNFLPRPIVISLAWDIVLNATIPAACYFLFKEFISPSELPALIAATIFPVLESVYQLKKRRELDPVAVIVLLGIVTSMLAMLFGGSPRLLLIRESFFTFIFGIACLLSLLSSRPIMFYFGRYFMAGKDEKKRGLFNAQARLPVAQRGLCIMTLVWGVVYVIEFGVRATMAFTLPIPIVLVVSPFLTGGATIFTIIWTFWYVGEMRKKIVILSDKTSTSPQPSPVQERGI